MQYERCFVRKRPEEYISLRRREVATFLSIFFISTSQCRKAHKKYASINGKKEKDIDQSTVWTNRHSICKSSSRRLIEMARPQIKSSRMN